MELFTPIQNALLEQLDALYPDRPIFLEEVLVEPGKEEPPANYFHVDVKVQGLTSAGGPFTGASVLVDIAAHLEGEGNKDYRLLGEELDRLFRPVFRFADRAATVDSAGIEIVDGLLHYTFPFRFLPDEEAPEGGESMQELSIIINDQEEEI